MIAFIKGTLEDIGENSVVIDCNGIGYEIFVPQKVFQGMPAVGEEVKLYTHLQVKEDGMALFGFLNKSDLEIFHLLILVNGIGPKGALGILSSISADELRLAVLAEDAKTIAKAPGIGIKTASKLILELKDKMKLEDVFAKEQTTQRVQNLSAEVEACKEEAIQALVALGYSATDALRAVKSVQLTETMTVDKLLAKALRNF